MHLVRFLGRTSVLTYSNGEAGTGSVMNKLRAIAAGREPVRGVAIRPETPALPAPAANVSSVTEGEIAAE